MGVPFDKRVGRMNEAMRLCKALWTGKPVDWSGYWTVKQGTVGPTPHRPGGPPIWFGGGLPAGRERTGRLYDGWFPNLPTPAEYPAQIAEVRDAAKKAGRDPKAIVGAMYLTLAVDDNEKRADEKINSYLAHYYGVPAAGMRARQRCYAGPAAGAAAWLKSYADAGATHLMLRFAGDHERHLDVASKIKRDLGW
jgi:alkanesulfonate monooxygenase SsuD/methylene tetrahydromethanopterin reductase-like flavin-dependent oxidoreductase (luciferase family)